jgi:hypothetical protein
MMTKRRPRVWKGWAVRDTDPQSGWSFWHRKADAQDFLDTWDTTVGPLIRVTITEDTGGKR